MKFAICFTARLLHEPVLNLAPVCDTEGFITRRVRYWKQAEQGSISICTGNGLRHIARFVHLRTAFNSDPVGGVMLMSNNYYYSQSQSQSESMSCRVSPSQHPLHRSKKVKSQNSSQMRAGQRDASSIIKVNLGPPIVR